MDDKELIQGLMTREMELDLVDKVVARVYLSDRPGKYIIALYDNRIPNKRVQGSWLCNEEEARDRIKAIMIRYGKETSGKKNSHQ